MVAMSQMRRFRPEGMFGVMALRALAKACGEAFLLTDAGGVNWNRAA